MIMIGQSRRLSEPLRWGGARGPWWRRCSCACARRGRVSALRADQRRARAQGLHRSDVRQHAGRRDRARLWRAGHATCAPHPMRSGIVAAELRAACRRAGFPFDWRDLAASRAPSPRAGPSRQMSKRSGQVLARCPYRSPAPVSYPDRKWRVAPLRGRRSPADPQRQGNGGTCPGRIPNLAEPGDNAWQMTAATLVGLMSVPGLVVLYGGVMQKRWSVNSMMLTFVAFAHVIVWCLWAFKMGFGTPIAHSGYGLFGTGFLGTSWENRAACSGTTARRARRESRRSLKARRSTSRRPRSPISSSFSPRSRRSSRSARCLGGSTSRPGSRSC